jgi:hypothetical protein
MTLTERSVTKQRYEAVTQALRHQVPVTEVAERLGSANRCKPNPEPAVNK